MLSLSRARGFETYVAHGRRFRRWLPTVRKVGVYAVIALIVPGGSLMALFFWVFRRRQSRR